MRCCILSLHWCIACIVATLGNSVCGDTTIGFRTNIQQSLKSNNNENTWRYLNEKSKILLHNIWLFWHKTRLLHCCILCYNSLQMFALVSTNETDTTKVKKKSDTNNFRKLFLSQRYVVLPTLLFMARAAWMIAKLSFHFIVLWGYKTYPLMKYDSTIPMKHRNIKVLSGPV